MRERDQTYYMHTCLLYVHVIYVYAYVWERERSDLRRRGAS
jgi:hypothetical protein